MAAGKEGGSERGGLGDVSELWGAPQQANRGRRDISMCGQRLAYVRGTNTVEWNHNFIEDKNAQRGALKRWARNSGWQPNV